MLTVRSPPLDPAPATITAVLAMHAGHICPSSELPIRPHLSALPVSSLPFSPSSDVGFSLRSRYDRVHGGQAAPLALARGDPLGARLVFDILVAIFLSRTIATPPPVHRAHQL